MAAIFAIAGIVMMTYADGFHSHSVIGIALVVGSASMSALYKVSTPWSFPTHPERCLSPSSLFWTAPVLLANLHAVQCHIPFFQGLCHKHTDYNTAFRHSLRIKTPVSWEESSPVPAGELELPCVLDK